jgi:tRNA dimethylallyltransferase
VEGWPALHAELARRDGAAAARIRPNDRQRIQRALEVIERTGRPISEQQAEDLRGATAGANLKLVLAPSDRASLAVRLEERFRAMLRAGFLDEVRALRARGDLHAGLPALRLIGYRQLWQHLEDGIPLDQAVEQAVAATRQFARRQLSWLRAEPGAEWFEAFDAKSPERIARRVAEWLRSPR